MNRVLFYFDVVCPYAYLGSTQIEEVCRRTGSALVWRPMLLGGVFNAIGRKDVPPLPAKMKAGLEDLQRWAHHWKVPLQMPAGHPRRTVDAMRLCVAAGERVADVARALYRAYWAEGRDVTDKAVLAEIARAHGLDPGRIEAAEVKEELRRNTDEAVAAGVFGAPSFVVTNPHGSFLFWGQDRLHFVEKALGGWRVPL